MIRNDFYFIRPDPFQATGLTALLVSAFVLALTANHYFDVLDQNAALETRLAKYRAKKRPEDVSAAREAVAEKKAAIEAARDSLLYDWNVPLAALESEALLPWRVVSASIRRGAPYAEIELELDTTQLAGAEQGMKLTDAFQVRSVRRAKDLNAIRVSGELKF